LRGALLAASLLAAQPAAGTQQAAGAARLEAMQDEIIRLRHELGALRGRERGILGEVERIQAELRLKQAEVSEIDARLALTKRREEEAAARSGALTRSQEERRRYLSFRLREMYKRGSAQELRRLVGGEESEAYFRGLAYASFLSARDGRMLAAYDASAVDLARAESALGEERKRLLDLRARAETARTELDTKRAERARLLEAIQGDSRKRVEALAELESAAKGLTTLVDRLEPASPRNLDIRKFRGLLDWPVDGRVLEGFGTAVHPRFRTVVPHPGLDLEAAEGSAFGSIFDGRVAYASWLHGYGLTVIVDHGNGVVSVYAHAQVLLVEPGDEVARGQTLGRAGETGSLRGPYLYLEVRRGGKAEDPASWLRRR
jgi:septal ring factor EnvC (AmiA/AmiB activator)